MTTSRVNVILQASFAGQNEFVRMGRNLRHLAYETSATGRVMDRFARMTTGSLRSMAGFLSKQVGNVFRSFFFGVRIYAIAAGAAISGFVGTSIRAFMDFDKKLRQTTSLIASAQVNAPNASGSLRKRLQESRRVAEAEYKAYAKALTRMAVPLSRRPTELAGGLTEIVSAGFSGRGPKTQRQVRSLLSASAMGAAAGGGETYQGARLLINAINALGIKPGGQKGGVGLFTKGEFGPQRLMDRIYQSINYGVGITFKELAASVGNAIGPIGAAMGGGGKRGVRNLNELMASIVVGSQTGLTAAKTTIGFTQILDKVIKPTKAGEEFLGTLGMKPGAKLLDKGLLSKGGFLEQLQRAMAKKGISGRTMTEGLRTLFGDIRAYRVITALYNTGLKNVQSVIDLVENSKGATKAAFDEYQKSIQGITDKFNALFEVVKIGIGKMLAPYVVSALNKFSGILDKITGGTKGMDLMAAFDAARAKNPSLSVEQFRNDLPRGQRDTFMRAYEFETAGFKANAKRLITDAYGAVRAWFMSPRTRKMLSDAFYRALDMAIGLLSRAAGAADNVYRFGLTLGVQIAHGIIKGLKDQIGGSGGIGGILGSSGMGITTGLGLPEKLLAGALGLGLTSGLQTRYAAGGSAFSRAGRGAFAMAGGLVGGLPPALLPLLGAFGAMQSGPLDLSPAAFRRRLGGGSGRSESALRARALMNAQTGGLAFPGEDMLLAAGLPVAGGGYDRGTRRRELYRAMGIGQVGGIRYRSGVLDRVQQRLALRAERGGVTYTPEALATQRRAAEGKGKPLTDAEISAVRDVTRYQSKVGNGLRNFLAMFDSYGAASTIAPVFQGAGGRMMSAERARELRDRRAPQQTGSGRYMGYQANGRYGFVSRAEFERQMADYTGAMNAVSTRRTGELDPSERARPSRGRAAAAIAARPVLRGVGAIEGMANLFRYIGKRGVGAAAGGTSAMMGFLRGPRGLRGVGGGMGAAIIPAAMALPDILAGGERRTYGIATAGGAALGGVAGAFAGGPMGAMIGATAGAIISSSLVDLFKQQEREREAKERRDTANRFQVRAERDVAAFTTPGTAFSLFTKGGKLKSGKALTRAMAKQRIAAARVPGYMEASVKQLTGRDVQLGGSAVTQGELGGLYVQMMNAKDRPMAEHLYNKILDILNNTGSDPAFAAFLDANYRSKSEQLAIVEGNRAAKRRQRRFKKQLRDYPVSGIPGIDLSLGQLVQGVGPYPTATVQLGMRQDGYIDTQTGQVIKSIPPGGGRDKRFKPNMVPDVRTMPLSITHGLAFGPNVPMTNAGAFSGGSFAQGAAAGAGPLGFMFNQAQPFQQGKVKDLGARFQTAGEVGPASFEKGFARATAIANRGTKQSVQSIFNSVIAEAERQFSVQIDASNAKGAGGRGRGGGATTRINAQNANGPGGRAGAAKLTGRGGSADDPGSMGGLFNRLGAGSAEHLAKRVTRSVLREQILTPKGPLGKAAQGLGWLKAQVGKPYIWGGGHPPALNLDGYDCSGLASSALMAMGYGLSGTTNSLIYNIDPNRIGPVMLGFNRKNNPSHMGISVFGQWFEAARTGTNIMGPGQARSNWPVVGAPMFHTGGVYRAPRPGGEGLALLRDGERVVPTATPRTAGNSGGGDITINIAHAEIRSDQDIKRVAAELHSMLATRRANSGRRY